MTAKPKRAQLFTHRVVHSLGEADRPQDDVVKQLAAAAQRWTQAQAQGTSTTLGQQLSCALVTATVNSWVRQMPIDLLVALVKHHLWTPQQGVVCAYQIAHPQRRFQALRGLLPYLPLAVLSHVLPKLLREMPPPLGDSGTLLLELAGYLPTQITPLLLEGIHALPDCATRARSLVSLAPHLPEGLRHHTCQAGIDLAMSLTDPIERVKLLAQLVPILSGTLKETVAQQAINETLQLTDQTAQAQLLVQLAPDLTPELRNCIFWVAGKLRQEEHRLEVFLGLLPYLAEPSHTKAQKRCLRMIRELPNNGDRVRCLLKLVPHLSEPRLLKVVIIARDVQYDVHRARLLTGLAPHVPEIMQAQLIQAARRIRDPLYRAQALTQLIPYVLEPLKQLQLFRKAQTAIQQINPQDYNESASGQDYYLDWLRSLVNLQQSLSPNVRAEMLQAIQAIADPWARLAVLAELPLAEQKPFLADIWVAVSEMPPNPQRRQLMQALLPWVIRQEIDVNWDRWLTDPDWDCWAAAIPKPLLPRALARVRTLNDRAMQALSIAHLAKYLLEADHQASLPTPLIPLPELAPTPPLAPMPDRLPVVLQSPLPNPPRSREHLAQDLRPNSALAKIWLAATHASPIEVDGSLWEAGLAELESLYWLTDQADLGFAYLTDLLPKVPRSVWPRVMHLILLLAPSPIAAQTEMAQLVSALANLAPADLEQLWSDLRPVLEQCDRVRLLAGLVALAPIIQQLGGTVAVQDLMQTIQELN